MTHHMQALLCIARQPGIRIRDIASELGITERAAHRIVSELVNEGYLTRHKLGARNFYEVHADRPLRRHAEGEAAVGDVLAPLLGRRDPP
jgi:DNA-binding Lrp family transcriptional regulator